MAPPSLAPVNELEMFTVRTAFEPLKKYSLLLKVLGLVLTSVTGTAELSWVQMNVSAMATATATMKVFILGKFEKLKYFSRPDFS